MKELKVIINGTETTIHFKDSYTRRIDKEYNSILFKGTDFSLDKDSIKFNQDYLQDANDFLIKSMTDLTEEQILDLSVSDYNEVLKIVNDIKNSPLVEKKVWLNNSEKLGEQTNEGVKNTEIIS